MGRTEEFRLPDGKAIQVDFELLSWLRDALISLGLGC